VITLSLTALLQLSIAASGTENYQEAYERAQTTGRPLVVMVGADWCPACRQMAENVMPEVKRSNRLENVVFAYVNLDQESELAGRLTRGGIIPQLIVFANKGTGWKRQDMIGAHSAGEVESFIAEVSGIQTSLVRPASHAQRR
jgi:thioredoxin-like negative regulator of GroEL